MIYRGKVVQITSQGVYVEIAELAIGMIFGPCQSVVSGLVVGQFALCVQVIGAMEDIIVVGRLDTNPLIP